MDQERVTVQPMPRMQLRDLHIFVAVVDCGSFTDGAAAVGMRQSPVSRAVQRLEAQVGAQLLDRNSRHVRMTPSGAFLYERAVELLGFCAATERQVRSIYIDVIPLVPRRVKSPAVAQERRTA